MHLETRGNIFDAISHDTQTRMVGNVQYTECTPITSVVLLAADRVRRGRCTFTRVSSAKAAKLPSSIVLGKSILGWVELTRDNVAKIEQRQ